MKKIDSSSYRMNKFSRCSFNTQFEFCPKMLFFPLKIGIGMYGNTHDCVGHLE